MKKLFVLLLLLTIVIATGCATDADIASQNLAKAGDMFEINRRVVFYNGITDKYVLLIEGRCSVVFHPLKFEVTVKTGPNQYKKHYLGRADNVFPFVEQMDNAVVDVYHSRVILKPQSIIPSIDLKIR